MKIVNGKFKKKNSIRAWTRQDRKLFRMNLAIYQADPGEPIQQQTAASGHRKAS